MTGKGSTYLHTSVRPAENRKQESDNAVRARIGESYQWLLAPAQSYPTDPLKWGSIRLTAQVAMDERACKRMRSGELLVTNLAGNWRGTHDEAKYRCGAATTFP